MNTHIVGPWINDCGSIKAIDHGKRFTIASVKSQKLTDEGNVANAKLIAAAPDLLKALKDIMWWWMEAPALQEDDDDMPAGMFDAAMHAIAKAQGDA